MKFEEMVQKLSKDGGDILVSLTPEKCHTVHMAMGIMGEAVELFAAINNQDEENIHEELGDLDFYMVGLCQSIPELQTGMMNVYEPVGTDIETDLIIAAGNVHDLVKKYVMYASDLKFAELQLAMNQLEYVVNSILQYITMQNPDITRDSIREQNMKKLLTGKNARYSEGYSDDAATKRADKAEGEK